MKFSHLSPPLPQSWEDAWSPVPELQKKAWQFRRVCHRLWRNSDICRLPLKCRRELHHCWHHMGKQGESASHHSLLGHSWSTPTYLKMKRYALQPLGLLTTCKKCTSSRHMQDCSKCSRRACTCLLLQPSVVGSEKELANCRDIKICFGSCVCSCFTWACSESSPLFL